MDLKTIYRVWFFIALVSVSNFVLSKENTIQNMRQEDYKQIRMYFVGWDILTRTKLSPDDVRRMRNVYIEVNDKGRISNIVNKIFDVEFTTFKYNEPEDARLVIELVKSDGKVEAFYANKTDLLTIDSKKYRTFGNHFNEVLNLLSTERKSPRTAQ